MRRMWSFARGRWRLEAPVCGYRRVSHLLPGVRGAGIRRGLSRHPPERPYRLLEAVTCEGNEARCNHRSLLDRRLLLLQVTEEPPRCDPRMSAGILPRDKHCQLERLGEADPS